MPDSSPLVATLKHTTGAPVRFPGVSVAEPVAIVLTPQEQEACEKLSKHIATAARVYEALVRLPKGDYPEVRAYWDALTRLRLEEAQPLELGDPEAEKKRCEDLAAARKEVRKAGEAMAKVDLSDVDLATPEGRAVLLAAARREGYVHLMERSSRPGHLAKLGKAGKSNRGALNALIARTAYSPAAVKAALKLALGREPGRPANPVLPQWLHP